MELRDDLGNVRVDFVWGNFPMQPNDDRDDNWTSFGGGVGDAGWDSIYLKNSDTLNNVEYAYPINTGYTSPEFVVKTNHSVVYSGWSNFPGFIPNYSGDDDSGLEAVVPNVTRVLIGTAEDALDAVGLDWTINYSNPSVSGVVSNGTTIRIYVDSLYGLRVGDQVWPDNDAFDYGSEQVTITAIDTESNWFEFETAVAPDPAIDTEAIGTVWPGDNIWAVVMAQDYSAGDIVDTGTVVELSTFGD